MEKHVVFFHMVNGETLRLDIEANSVEEILSLLNDSHEWLDFFEDGDTYYIYKNNIVSVKVTPQSVRSTRASDNLEDMRREALKRGRYI